MLHLLAEKRATTLSKTLDNIMVVARHGKGTFPFETLKRIQEKASCVTVYYCTPLPAEVCVIDLWFGYALNLLKQQNILVFTTALQYTQNTVACVNK